MSHLHDFPPPNSTDTTLCERNSKLIDKSATNVLDYRKISVKETLLHKKSLACSEMTPKEVFQSVEESAMDKILTKWEGEGLLGVLAEIESMDHIPAQLRVVVSKLHSLTDTLIQWKNVVLPKKVVTEVPGKRQIMVCHPHTGKIAVIAKESTVKLFNLNRIGETDQEVVLRDKRITEVTCLAWRPKAALSISAGCRSGIMVWLLDPTTAATLKPGSHAARFLASDSMPSAVTSMSWCSDGKLLACTCQSSSSFWVWNIFSQHNTTPPG
jgi:WD40 repeat protein